MSHSTCLVAGCTKPPKVRGYCKGHYQRVLRTGRVGSVEIKRSTKATGNCGVAGCDRPIWSRKLCSAHYQRWRTHGTAGRSEIQRTALRSAPCRLDGCASKSSGYGYCSVHYDRWKRNGDPGPVGLLHKPLGPCQLDGCDVVREALGYCKKHYRRFRRYGDPTYVEYARWTGDDVSYMGMHLRLRKQRGRAGNHKCFHCARGAEHWAYDYTDDNPKQDSRRVLYSLDLSKYIPLCAQCHQIFDRSMSILPSVTSDEWAAIRRWAQAAGLPVKVRGRIAASVVVAYLNTQDTGVPQKINLTAGVANKPDYARVHAMIHRVRGRAKDYWCNHCGRSAYHWAYDYTDINECYSEQGFPFGQDPTSYMPLCAQCHKRFDVKMIARRRNAT